MGTSNRGVLQRAVPFGMASTFPFAAARFHWPFRVQWLEFHNPVCLNQTGWVDNGEYYYNGNYESCNCVCFLTAILLNQQMRGILGNYFVDTCF